MSRHVVITGASSGIGAACARAFHELSDRLSLGARRTGFADAPAIEIVPAEALIEREPITVVCSSQGWIRAMKGHAALDGELKYKDGDAGRFVFHAQTTDKLLVFATNGRFYTIAADRLPGGRGMGEPVRLILPPRLVKRAASVSPNKQLSLPCPTGRVMDQVSPLE